MFRTSGTLATFTTYTGRSDVRTRAFPRVATCYPRSLFRAIGASADAVPEPVAMFSGSANYLQRMLPRTFSATARPDGVCSRYMGSPGAPFFFRLGIVTSD